MDFEDDISSGLKNANQEADDFRNLSESQLGRKSLYNTIFINNSSDLVSRWIQYFQRGKGRESMEKYLSRSSRYIYTMKEIFRRNDLPEELVYLAMVESGFSPYARSKAGALGYWQFLKTTGKQYGLRINTYVDERRDPILSTEAAARYLKELYRVVGAWDLALASYNTGKSRVIRASTKYGTRDFWDLSKRRAFSKETINYVPKFIAAVRIGENPVGYGFRYVNYQKPLQYDLFPLRYSISLRKLAGKLGISYQDMQMLNPSYLGEYVYIGSNTVIRIPPGDSRLARAVIGQCRIHPSYHPKNSGYYWYHVQRGDTLSELAEQSGSSVFAIQQMNGIRDDGLLLAGQRIKLPSQSSTKKL